MSKEILKLDYQIFNYHNMLDIEGGVKISLINLQDRFSNMNKNMIVVLEVIAIIYGINIPVENEQKYYKIFENWLDNYLIDECNDIFMVNHNRLDQIRYTILLILKNICL